MCIVPAILYLDKMSIMFIMPPRNPMDVAKSTGTLATLFPGRLRVCPAVGWMKDEYDVYGVDFHTRGRRCDEMIEVLDNALMN